MRELQTGQSSRKENKLRKSCMIKDVDYTHEGHLLLDLKMALNKGGSLDLHYKTSADGDFESCFKGFMPKKGKGSVLTYPGWLGTSAQNYFYRPNDPVLNEVLFNRFTFFNKDSNLSEWYAKRDPARVAADEDEETYEALDGGVVKVDWWEGVKLLTLPANVDLIKFHKYDTDIAHVMS